MTRPSPPRLPELAGMTEAGFNRVVDMIRWQDFAPRDRWGRVCGADFLESWTHWSRWRASLPKVRNKKQRKSHAKRVNFGSPYPAVHCCECDKKLGLFDDYTRDGKRYCAAHYVTPLQRLLKFAADDGTPVSFEIAEKAMKGGG